MGYALINDDAMWFKHIKDAPEIVAKAAALQQNEPITLLLDGKPVRFFRMRDGRDGRSTPGLRPDEAFRAYWRSKRDLRVRIALDEPVLGGDAYLASISTLFSEWDSPEDAAAYDGL